MATQTENGLFLGMLTMDFPVGRVYNSPSGDQGLPGCAPINVRSFQEKGSPAMSLPPLNRSFSGLGSLAQAARQKKLKQVRGLLLATGILVILWNALMLGIARGQIKQMLDNQNPQRGAAVEQAERQKVEDALVRTYMVFSAIMIGIGVVYILLAFLVQAFPVPITIIALVLYVGTQAVLAAKSPILLLNWFYLKIAMIIALIQAVITAVAYQKEQSAARPDLEPQYE
jgi:hypothetical protein